MNYGLYLSASGALANMYRQDVFANNLANVNTAGFKNDLAAITQRRPESREGGFGADLSHKLLDKLGGGVLAGPQKISFSQGPVQKTESPLDLAITSKNQFFVTEAPNGQSGVRLTRDGRLAIDSQGYLTTAAGGHHILDSSDQRIQLQSNAKAIINGKGQVLQNNQVVGQIQVTQITDTDRLIKQGTSLYQWTQGSDPRTEPEAIGIEPEAIEASSVDPVMAMMKLMDASRAAEGNANLIRYHDTLMDRAINTLGRIA